MRYALPLILLLSACVGTAAPVFGGRTVVGTDVIRWQALQPPAAGAEVPVLFTYSDLREEMRPIQDRCGLRQAAAKLCPYPNPPRFERRVELAQLVLRQEGLCSFAGADEAASRAATERLNLDDYALVATVRC